MFDELIPILQNAMQRRRQRCTVVIFLTNANIINAVRFKLIKKSYIFPFFPRFTDFS